jgi:hypothetical protein
MTKRIIQTVVTASLYIIPIRSTVPSISPSISTLKHPDLPITGPMFHPNELEKLLDFDMPHPDRSKQPSVKPTPEFTTKCHYILRIYACTHKSFSPSPRVTHISPCVYAIPSRTATSPILSQISPYDQLNACKKRCNNMVSKPREIHVNELCRKCCPHQLGAEKKLKQFEALVPDRGENEDVNVNEVMNPITTEDWVESGDQIERRVKALTWTETKTPSGRKPQPQSEPAPTAQNTSQIPEKDPTFEQISDSVISNDTLCKKERRVVARPSAPNGEAPLAAKAGEKRFLSRIHSPFSESELGSTSESMAEALAEGVWIGKESAENGGKASEERNGKWEKVRGDLDWEIVSDEESEEKESWREDGEWVNVNQ